MDRQVLLCTLVGVLQVVACMDPWNLCSTLGAFGEGSAALSCAELLQVEETRQNFVESGSTNLSLSFPSLMAPSLSSAVMNGLPNLDPLLHLAFSLSSLITPSSTWRRFFRFWLIQNPRVERNQ
jgi:hypothetical protein